MGVYKNRTGSYLSFFDVTSSTSEYTILIYNFGFEYHAIYALKFKFSLTSARVGLRRVKKGYFF